MDKLKKFFAMVGDFLLMLFVIFMVLLVFQSLGFGIVMGVSTAFGFEVSSAIGITSLVYSILLVVGAFLIGDFDDDTIDDVAEDVTDEVDDIVNN